NPIKGEFVSLNIRRKVADVVVVNGYRHLALIYICLCTGVWMRAWRQRWD
ncbi:biotin--[acetyl-CoA-carboxylase] ligase, partial [Vibrio parahaemolyticus V-223/04]